MSNVIASLEKVLLPFAVKIGKQPHVNAIKNGFIRLMPLTLAGAMFVLINNVFLSFGEGSFFYSLGIRLDASTIETLNGLKGIGGNVYNGTLGIMSYWHRSLLAWHWQKSVKSMRWRLGCYPLQHL